MRPVHMVLKHTTVELGSAVTGKTHYDVIISLTTNCSTNQIILGQANMFHSLSSPPSSYCRKGNKFYYSF